MLLMRSVLAHSSLALCEFSLMMPSTSEPTESLSSAFERRRIAATALPVPDTRSDWTTLEAALVPPGGERDEDEGDEEDEAEHRPADRERDLQPREPEARRGVLEEDLHHLLPAVGKLLLVDLARAVDVAVPVVAARAGGELLWRCACM